LNQNGAGLVIPSKEFQIWQRLYRRFSLEPFPAEGSLAGVGTIVVPTTDADRLLARPRITRGIASVTQVEVLLVLTVPLGERWTVGQMSIDVGSGTWTHSSLQLRDPIGGISLVIDAYSTSGGRILVKPPIPIIADELWEFYVNIAAFTGVGDLHFNIYREVEAAF